MPHIPGFSFRALFPRAPPTQASPQPRALTEQERKFAFIRRAFFGGGFLIATGYIYTQRHAFVHLYNLVQQLVAQARRELEKDAEIDTNEEDEDEADAASNGPEDEEDEEGL